MEKIGVTNFESYKNNPFTREGLVVRSVFEPGGDIETMYSEDTGEYLKVERLGKKKEFTLDTREFRKVYVDALPSIANFNIPALKVWCYILTIIKIKDDSFMFNLDECKEMTGYNTAQSIYNGLVELLQSHFIARSVITNKYFINSNMFYNGRRC